MHLMQGLKGPVGPYCGRQWAKLLYNVLLNMFCNIGNVMMGNSTGKGGRVVSRCKEKEAIQGPLPFDVVSLYVTCRSFSRASDLL